MPPWNELVGVVPPAAGEVDHTPVDPVVGARERHGAVPALGEVREADGGLDRVPAGDGEKDLRVMFEIPRQGIVELLKESDPRLGRKFEGVPDLARLSRQGGHEPRVTVPQVEDRDPSDPIDEPVAVDVLDRCTLRDLRGDGEVVRVGDRVRLETGLLPEQLPRSGPRRWTTMRGASGKLSQSDVCVIDVNTRTDEGPYQPARGLFTLDASPRQGRPGNRRSVRERRLGPSALLEPAGQRQQAAIEGRARLGQRVRLHRPPRSLRTHPVNQASPFERAQC